MATWPSATAAPMEPCSRAAPMSCLITGTGNTGGVTEAGAVTAPALRAIRLRRCHQPPRSLAASSSIWRKCRIEAGSPASRFWASSCSENTAAHASVIRVPSTSIAPSDRGNPSLPRRLTKGFRHSVSRNEKASGTKKARAHSSMAKVPNTHSTETPRLMSDNRASCPLLISIQQHR